MNENEIELLCRICLRNSFICSDIYTRHSTHGSPIYEVINYVYDLDIALEDGLPRYVCQQCLGIVKEFESYKKNAHRTKRELLALRERENTCVKIEEEECSNETSQDYAEEQIDHTQSFQKSRTEVCDEFTGPQSSGWLLEGSRGCQDDMEYQNDKGMHGDVRQDVKIEAEEDAWPYEGSISSSSESRGFNDQKRINITFKDSEDATMGFHTPDGCQENNSAPVVKTEVIDLEDSSSGIYETQDVFQDRVYVNNPSACQNHETDAEFLENGRVAQNFVRVQNLAELDSGEKHFRCGKCGYVSLDQRHLKTHACLDRERDAEFLGNGRVAQNFVRVSNLAELDSGQNHFRCGKCGYISLDQWHLKTHACLDHGENAFKCDFCLYKTFDSTHLAAHMSRHSGFELHQCGVCGYNAADRTHLKLHMYRHGGEKPFKCHACDYSTIDKTYLRNHMYKHTGEKPFKCHLCDYRAAVRSQLRPHMFTHTGEKRFECGLCNYRTAVKSNLKTHMYTHTGERPFRCTACDYKCSNSSALKAHLRTHTGEKPFKCHACDYRATTKSCFKKHVQKHM